ncbi:MAG: hypothetical protein A3H52_02640 [Candidatus Zambryskibacteria bacterium RIFCSPLOWO2_02_FULL_39_26]|uniref:HD domain-containing protein n=1 Tax=Candidatus Zambryskibacteria bacterium RIFCSPLOWO2_12_FULL_39_23 TaxID=1802776 RepID=A0A1G2UTP8_9BACT|nr:MAG: hypothetical protein A2W51_00095 [Candidatus Zambryskibacteria bacterium RIFCSPHIGHO2_02_39_10]OHA99876.1 MAG: hypothetical protein A3E59_01050 [Candidatus Zambryskibacteria bacterium RIFCSPHIGHO2_12_FULL_39_47]OHB10351.1 MAG: hypothetical protein A3H52_02640 [Candidatus Zambryskibacteria bacterium RIFCSPLOWO2_02_FULL_39_26]OHB12728.1 MAG: hypothetical protein A3G99_01505 [Candidatus Zambryskibacteria bacterium RIFCSPLOWO2_12_FULL_39_23]
MNTDITKITKFLHTMANLKKQLRFKNMPGWENANIDRWDSVAEHSYRMALMAVLYHPYLEQKPDLGKTLKMILVHDIVELIANDYSPMRSHGGAGGHAFDIRAYKDKYEREKVAAGIIFKDLPESSMNECISLWTEYAGTKLKKTHATLEGKYAYALDKLEAEMQIVDWKNSIINWTSERTSRSSDYVIEWTEYEKALSEVEKILKSEMIEMEK